MRERTYLDTTVRTLGVILVSAISAVRGCVIAQSNGIEVPSPAQSVPACGQNAPLGWTGRTLESDPAMIGAQTNGSLGEPVFLPEMGALSEAELNAHGDISDLELALDEAGTLAALPDSPSGSDVSQDLLERPVLTSPWASSGGGQGAPLVPPLMGPAPGRLPRPGFEPIPPRDSGAAASTLPGSWDDGTYWRRGLIKRVLSDQKFLTVTWWPQEIRSTRFSVPLLLSFVAAAAGREGQGLDQSVGTSIHSSSGSGMRRNAQRLTTFGNAVTAGALLGSTYMIGKWTSNTRLQETSSLSAEALLDAGIWVTFLKAVTARTRPSSGGQGRFFDYQPANGQVNGSFPSGHAMVAFAFATVVARQYEHKRLVPWIAYGTAAVVAYSRVALHRHWPSDVVVGAVLGHSIGRMVLTRAHGEQGGFPGSIQPIFDSQHQAYGLSWNYQW